MYCVGFGDGENGGCIAKVYCTNILALSGTSPEPSIRFTASVHLSTVFTALFDCSGKGTSISTKFLITALGGYG